MEIAQKSVMNNSIYFLVETISHFIQMYLFEDQESVYYMLTLLFRVEKK